MRRGEKDMKEIKGIEGINWEGKEIETIVVDIKKLKIDTKYQFHDDLDEEDFEALKESIKKQPQLLKLRPIITDEKLVIFGGRHRYKALKELGYKKVEVIRVKGLTEQEKKSISYYDNVGRNQNRFQKVFSTMRFLGLVKEDKKWCNFAPIKKMHGTGRWREIISKKCGVGERTVAKVISILKENPSKEIIRGLKEDVFSIDEIYKMYRAFEDVPDKVKRKLEKKFLKGEYTSQEVIKAITTTKAIKEQLEAEDDDVKEKAEKELSKKFWTKELDLAKAIWTIEEIAGDPHRKVRKEFPITKFKDFKEAQAWAVARNGTCLGRIEKWYIEYDPIEDKKLKEKGKKKA